MKARDALQDAMLSGSPLPVAVIDMHAHAGHYSGFYIPESDGEGMVKVMDSLGVATLFVSSHCAISSDVRRGNDLTADQVARFPGRFVGYAVANPHYPHEIEAELTRCFSVHGMRMIKLHPSIHHVKLTDPAYRPALEFAARHRAVVLTHTWEGDATCSPDVAAEAARRYPGVKFVWGHAGAPDFDRALEHARELPNVYLDLACSLVFEGQLEHFLERTPVEKVLYASDCPFLAMPQQLARVVFSELSEADKRRILHGNAVRLLSEVGMPLPKVTPAGRAKGA